MHGRVLPNSDMKTSLRSHANNEVLTETCLKFRYVKLTGFLDVCPWGRQRKRNQTTLVLQHWWPFKTSLAKHRTEVKGIWGTVKLGLEASAKACPLSVRPEHPREPHGRQLWLHLGVQRGQFYTCGGSISVLGPALRSIAGDRCSRRTWNNAADSTVLHQGEGRWHHSPC